MCVPVHGGRRDDAPASWRRGRASPAAASSRPAAGPAPGRRCAAQSRGRHHHLRRRRVPSLPLPPACLARLQVPYRYGTAFVRRSRRPLLQAGSSCVCSGCAVPGWHHGAPFYGQPTCTAPGQNSCFLFSHLCGLVATWEKSPIYYEEILFHFY